jgi:hypothetical protein
MKSGVMINFCIKVFLFIVAVPIWHEMRYKSNQEDLKRDTGSIKELLKSANIAR